MKGTSEVGILLEKGNGEERKMSKVRREEYEARESLLEQIGRQTMSAAEMARNLSGIKNIAFLLAAVYFLKEPLFRLSRGMSPLKMELLHWSFRGFWKSVGLFLMASVGTLASFALHYTCVRAWISVPTREAFHRVTLFLHILLSGKLIVGSDLSPVPSFALSCQSLSVFMKMHSYFVETRKKVDAEPGDARRWTSFRTFLYFVVAPTLVYFPDGYPRVTGFRTNFLIRKVFSAFGLLLLMYLIVTEWILPMLPRVHEMRTYEFLYSLILPCSAFFLSSFLLLFEVILNIIAEITGFADRLFYEDWWNSTTLDEFSRRWNRPVHDWLDKHIYRASLIVGLPKRLAMPMTFLFSAIFHEWVLALTFRRPRMYLFVLMIVQVPLIILLRGRFRGEHLHRFANIFLWFAFFLGLGILCACYAKEWYIDAATVLTEPL